MPLELFNWTSACTKGFFTVFDWLYSWTYGKVWNSWIRKTTFERLLKLLSFGKKIEYAAAVLKSQNILWNTFTCRRALDLNWSWFSALQLTSTSASPDWHSVLLRAGLSFDKNRHKTVAISQYQGWWFIKTISSLTKKLHNLSCDPELISKLLP